METSDIVYYDWSLTLTRILLDNGYLPRHLRRPTGLTVPRYLIEVKSTTGACDNAFFMSKSQYRRVSLNQTHLERREKDAKVIQKMQKYTFEHPNPQENATVYVIFRVYNLGKDNMSLRIYIDPEVLRRQDELRFTPESYSVTPVNDAEGNGD